MKVLVTGSGGFIGLNLIRELEKLDYKTVYLSNSSQNLLVELIKFDLNDLSKYKDSIIDFNPDIVIHLAWLGIPDYSQSNSLKNLNLSIEFLNLIIDKTDCFKIIITGSCWEYGKQIGVCNEKDILNLNSYFSWAKASLYNYVNHKCNEADISLLWLRLFYVYGPGQRSISLIQNLIENIHDNNVPEILYPNNRNDFVYVGDVVEVILKALKFDVPSGIYNVGSGRTSSVYEVCLEVESQLLNNDIISKTILKNGKNNANVDFYANVEKTLKFIKYKTTTSLSEGINFQLQYFLTKRNK